MNRFKKGFFKILIATDVSARGIDIPNVDYVINYDIPEQVENYVHRVGRTGRGTQRGNAISFCSEEEKEMLAQIETYLGVPIEMLEIDKKDYKTTIHFSKDTNESLKSLLKEIEAFQEKKKKKRKK
jgi:ATP-dependent RNA helicase RhlE